MNADSWKGAHGTPPGELPKAPGDTSDVRFVQTLWTLRYKSHTVEAQQHVLPGTGFDLRYLIDGELRETELFKGTDGGTKSALIALAKRDQLLAKGWVIG